MTIGDVPFYVYYMVRDGDHFSVGMVEAFHLPLDRVRQIAADTTSALDFASWKVEKDSVVVALG